MCKKGQAVKEGPEVYEEKNEVVCLFNFQYTCEGWLLAGNCVLHVR
jgi:hypothetical protein